MAGSFLVTRANFSDRIFDWIFLVWYLVFGITSVVFLFYFNRALGLFTTLIVRIYASQRYGVQIRVKAVQLSPLAGRLFFKGFSYYGQNETILAHEGYITWRYWLLIRGTSNNDPPTSCHGIDQQDFKTADKSDATAQHDTSQLGNDQVLSKCRIIINARGLQWFIYNRSAAYDSLLQQILGKSESWSTSGSTTNQSDSDSASGQQNAAPPKAVNAFNALISRFKNCIIRFMDFATSWGLGVAEASHDRYERASIPPWLSSLPIGLDLGRGAIVLGNDRTTSVAILTCDSGQGTAQAVIRPCLSAYKLKLDILLRRLKIQFKDNLNLVDGSRSVQPSSVKRSFDENQSPRSADNKEVKTDSWQGLSRYLDETDQVEEQWHSTEYAKVETIVECSEMRITYHWDTVLTMDEVSLDYGITLTSDELSLNYGPWADEKRASLQKAFFPPLYKDQSVTKSERSNASMITELKLVITINSVLSLHVPTKEQSKDHLAYQNMRYNKANGVATRPKHWLPDRLYKHQRTTRQDARPYGRLDITMLGQTLVNMTIGLVAKDDGFHNSIHLSTNELRIVTSVNQELFISATNLSLSVLFQGILEWQALHSWRIRVENENMKLFLLRDHVFLLTDLINDWISRSISGYQSFVPFKYILTGCFKDVQISLFVNQDNIIENAMATDENTIVLLRSPLIDLNVDIPSHLFNSLSNTVKFNAFAHGGTLGSSSPAWNTRRVFLANPLLARVDTLSVQGAYTFYNEGHGSNPATLMLTVDADSIALDLYGFLVKHLMILRENYFGANIHHRARQESPALEDQTRTSLSAQPKVPLSSFREVSTLDVILKVSVQKAVVNIPSHIYKTTSSTRIEIPFLVTNIRVTNHFVDITVFTSPISLVPLNLSTTQVTEVESLIVVEFIEIQAHRLLGLPPSEPAYVCNWNFDIGSISGKCSIQLVKNLYYSAKCFALTYKDLENIDRSSNDAAINDVTYLRTSFAKSEITILHENITCNVAFGDSNIWYNDQGSALLSECVRLDVPHLEVSLSGKKTQTDDPLRKSAFQREDIAPMVHCNCAFSLIKSLRMADHGQRLHRQMHHVSQHDSQTLRTPWLSLSKSHESGKSLLSYPLPFRLPSMPAPLARPSIAPPSRLHTDYPCDHEHALLDTIEDQKGVSTRGLAWVPQGWILDDLILLPSIIWHETFSHIPTSTSLSPDPSGDFYHTLSAGTHTSPYSFLKYVEAVDKTTLRSEKKSIWHVPTVTNFSDFRVPLSKHQALYVRVEPESTFSLTDEAVIVLYPLQYLFSESNVDFWLDEMHFQSISKESVNKSKQTPHLGQSELLLDAPELRLSLVIRSESSTAHLLKTQISLHDLQCTLRSSHDSDQDTKTLQLASKSFIASFETKCIRSPVRGNGQLCEIQAKNAGLWFHKNEKVVSEARISQIRAKVDGSDQDFLAAVLSLQIFMRLARRLDRVAPSKTRSVTMITMILIKEAAMNDESVSMPQYDRLTKTQAGLIRLSDSWTIVARLRQIICNVSPEVFNEINTCLRERSYLSGPLGLEHDEVIRFWQRLGIRQIFEAPNLYQEASDPRTSLAQDGLVLSLRIGDVHLEKQSEAQPSTMSAKNSMARIHLCENRVRHGEHKSPAFRSCAVRLQIFNSQLFLKLDWSLLSLFHAIFDCGLRSSEANSRIEAPLPSHYRLQALCVTNDLLNIEVVAPSISHRLVLQRLCASSLGSELDASDQSTVISAGQLYYKTSAGSEAVVSVSLTRLRIFNVCGHDRHRQGSISRQFKLLIGSSAVSTHSEPLNICAIIQKTLDTEIRQIFTSLDKVRHTTGDRKDSVVEKDCFKSTSYVLSLQCGEGDLNLMIAPRHKYHLTIFNARLAFCTSSAKSRLTAGEASIGQYVHALVTGSNDERVTNRFLNGSFMSLGFKFNQEASKEFLSLQFFSEVVDINAETLHTLLVVLDEFSVGQVVKAVGDLVTDIKDIMSDPRKSPSKVNQYYHEQHSRLAWTLGTSIVGVNLYGLQKSQSSKHSPVKIVIDLGCVTSAVSNHDSGRPLRTPKFNVKSSEVQIKLGREADLQPISTTKVSMALDVSCLTSLSSERRTTRKFTISLKWMHISFLPETPGLLVAIHDDARQLLEAMQPIMVIRQAHSVAQGRGQLVEKGVSSEMNVVPNPVQTFVTGSQLAFTTGPMQISWDNDTPYSEILKKSTTLLFISVKTVEITKKRDLDLRLMIYGLKIELRPSTIPEKSIVTSHAAMLSTISFTVEHEDSENKHKFIMQAVGKGLELHVTPRTFLLIDDVKRVLATSADLIKHVSTQRVPVRNDAEAHTTALFHGQSVDALLLHGEFASATVSGRLHDAYENASRGSSVHDNVHDAHLQSPGLAIKLQYQNMYQEASLLNAELRVSASSNVLEPTVMPTLTQIYDNVQRAFAKSADKSHRSKSVSGHDNPNISTRLTKPKPSAFLGNCRLNLGMQIHAQEFQLSCHPIARLRAYASFDDIYMSMNSFTSDTKETNYAFAFTLAGLQASIRHVYSRDPTGSFKFQNISLSFMNHRHVAVKRGMSAILAISLLQIHANARQWQDFLLFRDVWTPEHETPLESSAPRQESESVHPGILRRYQQLASHNSIAWTATVNLDKVDMQVDMGTALGKMELTLQKAWLLSKKSSDWKQDLCTGIDEISGECIGRLGGLIALRKLKTRTSIQWSHHSMNSHLAPFVQALVNIESVTCRIGFDYHDFCIMKFGQLQMIMYNIRSPQTSNLDRLVAALHGTKLSAFITSNGAARIYNLFQACEKLFTEQDKAYVSAVQEAQKNLRRASSARPRDIKTTAALEDKRKAKEGSKARALQLQTGVYVHLEGMCLGVFSNTLQDRQLFKIQTSALTSRFTVVLDPHIHCSLGMDLSQLSIALATLDRVSPPSKRDSQSMQAIIQPALDCKNGIILKVPRLVARMQTWQVPDTKQIDYTFRSEFQGKVEVGWNYSRISYIRGMYANHARTLAEQLGKPLPESAVKITGLESEAGMQHEKITAVVNVPISSYTYRAIEPAIIETPQLKDMGEATPPLEWIGLQRERLPTLTHQIVIVSLLKIAREVDDAYAQILGSA